MAVRAKGKTKNEDEVNDIRAGYRILPSRVRPRLPPSFRLFLFSLSSLSRALRSRSLKDTPRKTCRILHN